MGMDNIKAPYLSSKLVLSLSSSPEPVYSVQLDLDEEAFSMLPALPESRRAARMIGFCCNGKATPRGISVMAGCAFDCDVSSSAFSCFILVMGMVLMKSMQSSSILRLSGTTDASVGSRNGELPARLLPEEA